jgi:hypothetical protein
VFDADPIVQKPGHAATVARDEALASKSAEAEELRTIRPRIIRPSQTRSNVPEDSYGASLPKS